MSPFHLVHPEISKKLPVYGKIKKFLERFDVQVPQTTESGTLVARKLIRRIWNDEEFTHDRRTALELFDTSRKAPIGYATNARGPSHGNSANSAHSNQHSYSSRQVANEVAKRFSNSSMKFSGETTECWSTFLAKQ